MGCRVLSSGEETCRRRNSRSQGGKSGLSGGEEICRAGIQVVGKTSKLQGSRPTQSIMCVPLQVNRFQKRILLIVQYKYLESCSGDFYSPESDPPHKIMRYWFYYSIWLVLSFPPDHAGQVEMFCTTVVPVLKGHLGEGSP